MSVRSFFASSVSIAALLIGATANAQEQAAADVEQVVVTGSRTLSSGDKSPTPLTVISKEQMSLGAPATISDALAQVPEFRGSTRPGTALSPLNPSGAFLNLRGLGTLRTLVLVNGRRTVPTTLDGRIDTNTIPDLLVQRVDVVTGGASAAYGSDAVAGVVNYVLDENFDGLKGDFGGGVSSRSDNQNWKARVAAGFSLLDDRLHLVVSADYFKDLGVLSTRDRAWDQKHTEVIVNPTYPTDGRTAFLWRSNVTGSSFTTGGVITGGPLKGTQFLDGGAPGIFRYGTEVSSATMVGGDGYWNSRGNVYNPLENKNLFAHAKFEVRPDLKVFAEASYSNSASWFIGVAPSFFGGNGITIFNDNAFLPEQTKTAMAGAGITSFPLGRISPDWGKNQGVSHTATLRGAFGLEGVFREWSYDGSVDFGHSDVRLENNNSPNQTRLYEALDAVTDTTGRIVCRSNLLPANANDGCVPLDPFGTGSASPSAIKYVYNDGYSNISINQINGEINLRGSPITLPAGDVEFATGFAYRQMDAESLTDPLSQTVVTAVPNTRGVPASVVNRVGVYLTGNQSFQPKRSTSVSEEYGELQIPVLRDVPLIEALDLNGAIRYADYSQAGGNLSWKLGGTWQVDPNIRLRATRSRDVRAPTIPDLYSQGAQAGSPIFDPIKQTNNNTPVYSGGNPNLKPEESDTVTAGFVLTPQFIPGLSVAVDYYDIEIGNAIGSLRPQNIVDLCFQGVASDCSLVTRLGDGTLVSVNNFQLNVNKLVTEGVDFETNYGTSIGPVDVNIRALASFLDKLATTDPFGTTTDQAGVNGGTGTGSPTWQGTLSGNFTYGAYNLFLQERFTGSGSYSSDYTQGGTGSTSLDRNKVGSIAYTDVTVGYRFKVSDVNMQLYGTINNLLDRDPPQAPSRTGAPVSIINTNPTLYDVVGRQYTIGLRFQQ